MKTTLTLIVLILLNSTFFAQSIIVDANRTTSDIILSEFIENQTISNLKVNGLPLGTNDIFNNITLFQKGNSNFMLNNGILLTTGNGINAQGPNSLNNSTSVGTLNTYLNDSDISQISGGTVTTGVCVEFDIVADGTELEFEYIFASEEYPEYVCSKYNDIFGIVVSGDGITGTLSNGGKNIALVPDPNSANSYTNTSVGINSINAAIPGNFSSNPTACNNMDPNWTQYSVFFTANPNNSPSTQFNGYTVPLTAKTPVTCGATYHLKIFVVNVTDVSLDSGVFFKRLKFNNKPVVDFTPTPSNGIAPLSTTIINNSQNIDTFDWNFGNGYTENNITITEDYNTIYTDAGTYYITVVGKKDLCIVESTQEVIVVNPSPLIEPANIFSPNEDGINDIWSFNKNIGVGKIQLLILNRWGNVVFEDNSFSPKWDGKDKNGQPLLEGVYFYKYITNSLLDNEKLTGQGFIHLKL